MNLELDLKFWKLLCIKFLLFLQKIGAEGLPLKNNESIFLEDNPKKFANKIISISKNNKTLRKIGIKSNYVVLKNFSEKAQINDAKKLLKKL